MTVAKKLLLTSGGFVALTCGLALSSIFSIGGLAGLLDVAVNKTARKMVIVGQMEVAIAELRNATRMQPKIPPHSPTTPSKERKPASRPSLNAPQAMTENSGLTGQV